MATRNLKSSWLLPGGETRLLRHLGMRLRLEHNGNGLPAPPTKYADHCDYGLLLPGDC